MPFTFRTKPRGVWANFQTECGCGGVLTITGGRIEWHDCREEGDRDGAQVPVVRL